MFPRAPPKSRSLSAVSEAPIDLLSFLVFDELAQRGERLLERREKQTQFRDSQKSLENFDFHFNKKMKRSLVFDLATGAFIAPPRRRPISRSPGTGKSSSWLRPSAKPPFNGGTACSTAKPALCSMSWPKRSSMARAKRECSS